jgi:hypothetical protein
VGLAAVLVGFNSYLYHEPGMEPILVNIHLSVISTRFARRIPIAPPMIIATRIHATLPVSGPKMVAMQSCLFSVWRGFPNTKRLSREITLVSPGWRLR